MIINIIELIKDTNISDGYLMDKIIQSQNYSNEIRTLKYKHELNCITYRHSLVHILLLSNFPNGLSMTFIFLKNYNDHIQNYYNSLIKF